MAPSRRSWSEAVEGATEVDLWLTADELKHDIVVPFKVPIRCPQCWGSGRSADKQCLTCRGWCMIDGIGQWLTAPIAAADFYDGIEYLLGSPTTEKFSTNIKITIRVDPDQGRGRPPWQSQAYARITR